jgi:hypothetical protein
MKTNVEDWWYDTDMEKLKLSEEKNLSQCQFIYSKSHVDWPGTEACAFVVGAGDYLSHIMPFSGLKLLNIR